MTDHLNDYTAEELENCPFADLLRESLTLEHLMETEPLETEDGEDEEVPNQALPGRRSGEVSARAAEVARLAIEAKRQATRGSAA